MRITDISKDLLAAVALLILKVSTQTKDFSTRSMCTGEEMELLLDKVDTVTISVIVRCRSNKIR